MRPLSKCISALAVVAKACLGSSQPDFESLSSAQCMGILELVRNLPGYPGQHKGPGLSGGQAVPFETVTLPSRPPGPLQSHDAPQPH